MKWLICILFVTALVLSTQMARAQNPWIRFDAPASSVQALNDDTLYAFSWPVLYRTTNSGDTWETLPTGYSSTSYASSGFWVANYNIIAAFTGEWGPEDNFIIRTTNAAKSWGIVKDMGEGAGLRQVGTFDGGLLLTFPYYAYAVKDTVIEYHPTNGTVVVFADSLRFGILQCSMTSSGMGMIIGGAHQLLSTTNYRTGWTDITSRVSDTITSIAVRSGAGWLVGSNHAIYQSNDSGKTWSQVLSTPSSVTQLAIRDSNIAYAILATGIIEVTIDGGLDWSLETPNLNDTVTSIQLYAAHSLLVNTKSGAHYLKLSDSAVIISKDSEENNFWASVDNFSWSKQDKQALGELLLHVSGRNSLKITSISSLSLELSIPDTSFTIPPGGQRRINFSVNSNSSGIHTTSIILYDNSSAGFDTVPVHWNTTDKAIDNTWEFVFNPPSQNTGLIALFSDSSSNIFVLRWQGKSYDTNATVSLIKFNSIGKNLWTIPIPNLKSLFSAIDRYGDVFLFGQAGDSAIFLKYGPDGSTLLRQAGWNNAVWLSVNPDGFAAIAFNTNGWSIIDTAYKGGHNYYDDGDGIATEISPTGVDFDQIRFAETSVYTYYPSHPALEPSETTYGRDFISTVAVAGNGELFVSAIIDTRQFTQEQDDGSQWPPPQYVAIIQSSGPKTLWSEAGESYYSGLLPDNAGGVFVNNSSMYLDSTGYAQSASGTAQDQLLPGNLVLAGTTIRDTALRIVRQFSMPSGSSHRFIDRSGNLYAMLATDSLLIRIDPNDTFSAMQPYHDDSLRWSLTSYVIDPDNRITAAVTRTHPDSTQDFVLIHHAHTYLSAVSERKIEPSGRILLYPQPMKDVLTINLPEQETGQANIEILDVMGRTCFRTTAELSSSLTLRGVQLPAGIYLIQILTPKGLHYTSKLIIE